MSRTGPDFHVVEMCPFIYYSGFSESRFEGQINQPILRSSVLTTNLKHLCDLQSWSSFLVLWNHYTGVNLKITCSVKNSLWTIFLSGYYTDINYEKHYINECRPMIFIFDGILCAMLNIFCKHFFLIFSNFLYNSQFYGNWSLDFLI